MPLRPVTGKLIIPVESADDVPRVFEAGIALSTQQLSAFARECRQRDLEDHFFYIGAIMPEAFRPLQEDLVRLPDEQIVTFSFTHHTWLYLLYGAPDVCVDQLVNRLSRPNNPNMVTFALQEMLMGICTPAALEALATCARKTSTQEDIANAGFWMPPDGSPAVPRFTRQRMAARLVPFDGSVSELEILPHPVGLPLELVMNDPDQDVVVWHYCTVDASAIGGMPASRVARLHLVGPPLFDRWTVFSAIGPNGRYGEPLLSSDTEIDEEEMVDLRNEALRHQEAGRGMLELLPYDDNLVYCNGHVLLTPEVEGDVGGAPIGVYANPLCPTCHKLMFHVASFENGVREFGEGFRCLYVCEDCMIAASRAVSSN